MKTKYILFALTIILTLSNCEKLSFEEEPMNNPVALFENFWNTFNDEYASFEVRGIDWDAEYDRFRPQLSMQTSDEELKDIFKQMLRKLDDGHVSLVLPNEEIFTSNLIYDQEIGKELFDLDLIKTKYMNGEYLEDDYKWNTYGWIGNTGYVNIFGFRDNLLQMNDILDYFEKADGLIIDLRANDGGDFTYALTEFSRLTNEKRFVFKSRTKTGKGQDDYTEWHDWYINPSGEYFDKPLVLLTDRLTISAGERAVMILKTLPNLTHLGDTTNGAFATKIGKELANGWNYSLVAQQLKYADGKDYEGTGMPPDYFMKNTIEEINSGTDKILEEALEIIYQNSIR